MYDIFIKVKFYIFTPNKSFSSKEQSLSLFTRTNKNADNIFKIYEESVENLNKYDKLMKYNK